MENTLRPANMLLEVCYEMDPFTIVVDTSCDLPPEYIREHGIGVLPIPFYLDDIEHSKGYWQEISGGDFYGALRKGSSSRTSQINPETFFGAFTDYAEQGKDALFLLLSSGLSTTYHNAMIALGDVKETFPGCGLYPVDSIGATALNTLLAMLAVDKRNEGLSVAETAAWLEEKKQSVLGFFTADDLMYLHRGGRLSKLSAVGGSVLGIKPVLNIGPDGTLALKDKARGREAALRLLVSQLKRSIYPDTPLGSVVITHTDCRKDADKLADMVSAAVNVKQIHVFLMGPVIGAHVGPGAVTLVCEADMTREQYNKKFYD